MESVFAQLDFAQKELEEQNRDMRYRQEHRQKLIDSGTVSALDLEAPLKAISEFNKGSELLQNEHTKEAILHFEKAIAAYPKFVSAHSNLGVAYQDLDDIARAHEELQTAASLDPKFAASYVTLGKFELLQKDFAAAESNLDKAAALRPTDPKILTVLAYAQNSNHEYRHVIDTAAKVQSLPHKGLANVHYVAASAAIALKDFDVVQRELELFLKEDPTNPLSPSAAYNLKILASYKQAPAAASATASQVKTVSTPVQEIKTFPNSDALKNALAGLDDNDDACTDCSNVHEVASSSSPRIGNLSPKVTVMGTPGGVWKIREVIDEVAVFFAVTNHGSLVNDLAAKDLSVRDDNKPAARVLQFTPQSKLPLRLGLLIDTSGSLQRRFDFEKKAAGRFVDGILRNSSDLAFVGGFANDVNVTQDFTADTKALSGGIDELTINGGTAIWDAVSFACWKLAALPETERVAKVLVILTDGEDNASHITLKRAIHDAETTGVTVYTISTRDYEEMHKFGMTDADKVLQALSEHSGGEAMFPGEMSALDKTFSRLRDVIRSRYLVAYKPADFQNDGHFRKITIIATRNGKHLKVHARDGYYAPLEAKN
jgi:VWFA-related protein